jgi:hypothetical protein
MRSSLIVICGRVQIQILLYFLKLSLPGSAPVARDRLESFMDKLSMWQLMHRLDSGEESTRTGQRDWMQVFCEDVVEPEYVSDSRVAK